MMAVFNLTVNGKAQTLNATPETPLLWVLRDRLDLTGTKFGYAQILEPQASQVS